MIETPAAPAAPSADDTTAEITREVAQAMFSAGAEEGETFDALPPDEQEDIEYIAGLAIAAYRGWLTRHGYRMTPPGTFASPSCEQEGRAMLAVAQGYLASIKRKHKLVSTPGLILPGSRH